MKEKTHTHENDFTEPHASPMNRKVILSMAEWRRLIDGSYCHQYGVLIRLAHFSGLRVSELLGLQWSDLDFDNYGLRIQHQYVSGSDGKGYRIAQTAPRFVPVPIFLLGELAELHEAQRNTLAMYNLTAHSNSVAITLKGHQMPDWILEYYFKQILQFCGLPDYSLSVLRDTFAVNAIMQGMDVETLSEIMGEPHVKNIYARYIPDRTNIGVEDYNTELNEQTAVGSELSYPVIAKSFSNGLTQFYAPDFPKLTCASPVLAYGLIIMRKKIEDELHYGSCCPTPVPVSDIPLEPDECIVQISVNP